MAVSYMKYAHQPVKISQHQAWRILYAFWPESRYRIPTNALTPDDRRYAQTLLIDTACRATAFNLVTTMYQAVKPGSSAGSLLKDVGKEVIKYLTHDRKIETAIKNGLPETLINVVRMDNSGKWPQRAENYNGQNPVAVDLWE